jgi:predicted ATPase
MAFHAPIRAVITGGPGTGKSTLMAAAEVVGIPVFPEVARSILRKSGGMEMRAYRPRDFASAMQDAEIAAWHSAANGPALYDRGFPDIVGFLMLEGLPIPADLDRICNELRYDGPIFHAPPWAEIYTSDEQRVQDWQQAIASDDAVSTAWKSYGYRLTDLPLKSVPERLEFVMDSLPGLRR